MNLFFGKISKAFDVNQLKEGYYISPKGSSWFANIEPEDYVYIIGGDKIQFWRAKEWGEKDGKECLWFEILNDDLGISIRGLAALKFLKVTSDLIVMTSRSARNRAFFQLELLEDISVEKLKKSVTYTNDSIYRAIKILESKQFVEDSSKDIQFFYEDEELRLYPSNFLDERVINSFTDNLKYIGRGAPRKDKTLSLIQRKKPSPVVEFSHEEISLLNLYDAFFCEYKTDEKYYLAGAYWSDNNPADQTPRFVKESIWVNGYPDKYTLDVNKVPRGSKIAIKSSYTKDRTNSVMLIKARGTVVENPKDGQNLTVEWEEDFQPFEVRFGGYRGTIKQVESKEHIDTIWNTEYEMGDKEEQREALNKEKYSLNQILYGPPGTGKTYSTIDLAAKIIGFDTGSHTENLKAFNEQIGKNIEFVTFHQSFAYEDFIEGIKPLTRDKQVVYEVQDGVFKKLAARAREEKTEETHVLIIDEINRGNVAAIFGELITLIEEDKRAGGKNPISTTLPYSKTEFAVPSNLYLIGTMNTADRSVEALDTALRRRFSFTEVGPQPELLSPKAMIVRLLNERKYADLGWEEEPYHSHARKLYDFLGVAPDGVEEPLRERAEVGEGYWEKADLEHLSPDDFTGVQLDKLLRTINLRIARLIDRDHMIGHAYFMGIATAPDPWQALKDVFHRNILPLLQEYFFGDYAKIGLVLGKGFVSTEKEEEKVEFADFYDEASAELASQMQYLLEDVSNMSLTDFKKAVWKISPDSNADKHG